jgi:phage tail P2-like protein
MAKDLYGLSLTDIIPSSVAGDPQVIAMISAFDPELSGVTADIREALIYSRIDELPEPAVDLLAWQFHADFYEPVTMDLETKRAIVKSTIMVHRKKGTPWAVRRLLTDLGFQVEYTEWWQFGGEPFVDRLKVWIGDGFDFSNESRKLIMLAWNLTKSERTHLESLAVALWFADDYGFLDDSGGLGETDDIIVHALLPLFDLYPWIGLRYGEFNYGKMLAYGEFEYGDGSRYGGGSEGTRYYGEDTPDILGDFAGTLRGLEETHSVPALYGSVTYGDFTFGGSEGVQDSGGEIVCTRPLVYGRFAYGDGMARYGNAVYGEFTYGASVKYGGEVQREAI